MQCDSYDKELHNVETFHILDQEPEVIQESEDQYVNAETLLLRKVKWYIASKMLMVT